MAGAVQRPAFPTKGRASNIRTLVAALGLGNSLLTNYYVDTVIGSTQSSRDCCMISARCAPIICRPMDRA
jgi:hypothetical protein